MSGSGDGEHNRESNDITAPSDKLGSRPNKRVGGYGSASNKKGPAHIFKHNEKWCKWTVRVDKMAIIRFEMSEEIK